MEGLRKGFLALGLGPGRGAQVQAVFSDSLSVPAPASAPVVFLSSWALAAAAAGAPVPPPRTPCGLPGPGFLLALPVRLWLCPHRHALTRSLLQPLGSSLRFRFWVWEAAFGASLLPVLQHQASSNQAGTMALAGQR